MSDLIIVIFLKQALNWNWHGLLSYHYKPNDKHNELPTPLIPTFVFQNEKRLDNFNAANLDRL